MNQRSARTSVSSVLTLVAAAVLVAGAMASAARAASTSAGRAQSTAVAQGPSNPVAQAGSKFDVTGKWLFKVETSAGSGTPTFTFKQDDEKLTGHYSGQLGEADLTGTVKGQAINFSFSGEAQGIQIDVTYSGTIESKDSIKGRVTLAGVGEGTFVGQRQ